MDADGIAKLLEALAKLIGVLAWPLALIFILIRFRSGIGEFLSAVGEVTFKGGGFEASAKRRQSVAGAALVAAAVSRTSGGATPEDAADAAKEAVQLAGSINSRTIRRVAGSVVLWVDDRPDNNKYERQALEALGIRFVLARSTDDVLEKMKNQHFDLIISDMGRPPDPQAGYTLLDTLRSSGHQIPFIIYAGSRSPEHQREAKRKGAIGCTNMATELFEMVIDTLGRT